MKFTSKKSKATATIDYFLKLKNGTLGSVDFYFVIYKGPCFFACVQNNQYQQPFQHRTGNTTGQYIVFSIEQIEKKLVYMKIRKVELLTSIPNRYEKS